MTDARGVFKFDLTSISDTITIAKATLTLKHVGSTVLLDSAFSIHKISEDWYESSITWENKPAYENRLSVGSLSENFITFDVTDAVNDFIVNPVNDFGLEVICIINMQNSYIASSEYEDESLRPKLSIEYNGDGGIPVIQNTNSVFAANDFKVINTNKGLQFYTAYKGNSRIQIFNLQGREVYKTDILSKGDWIKILTNLSKGIHLVKFKTPEFTAFKEIFIVE